jgi:hypothetical protein
MRMRGLVLGGSLLAAVASGLAAGFLLFSPQPKPVAGPELIASAQRSSYWGGSPAWIDYTGDERLFRQVRDRAFAYCHRDGAIPRSCADAQDGAVQAIVLTLVTVEAQRRMPDKSRLSERERWIADHPEVVARARNYCWALYDAHGGMDARLLSACLGNLVGVSEVVSLPVFD